MEKQLIVKWDNPQDEHWFNAEGLEQILNNYFPNTVFKVKEIPVNYSMKVTEKMREAEAFVDEYIKANGRPPSYRQVANKLGLKSPNTAYARLRRYRKFMKIK